MGRGEGQCKSKQLGVTLKHHHNHLISLASNLELGLVSLVCLLVKISSDLLAKIYGDGWKKYLIYWAGDKKAGRAWERGTGQERLPVMLQSVGNVMLTSHWSVGVQYWAVIGPSLPDLRALMQCHAITLTWPLYTDLGSNTLHALKIPGTCF